ncbi:hypothetical protein SUDANB120_06274 (plasmid) [Streptomyces sp. enrichment culture]
MFGPVSRRALDPLGCASPARPGRSTGAAWPGAAPTGAVAERERAAAETREPSGTGTPGGSRGRGGFRRGGGRGVRVCSVAPGGGRQARSTGRHTGNGTRRGGPRSAVHDVRAVRAGPDRDGGAPASHSSRAATAAALAYPRCRIRGRGRGRRACLRHRPFVFGSSRYLNLTLCAPRMFPPVCPGQTCTRTPSRWTRPDVCCCPRLRDWARDSPTTAVPCIARSIIRCTVNVIPDTDPPNTADTLGARRPGAHRCGGAVRRCLAGPARRPRTPLSATDYTKIHKPYSVPYRMHVWSSPAIAVPAMWHAVLLG